MKATEHVIFDIDELISFGTVKMSTKTLEAFKAELNEKESGHHVGNVAFIHSLRAATNERLAEEEAERQRTAPELVEPGPEPDPEPEPTPADPVPAPAEEHHEGQ